MHIEYIWVYHMLFLYFTTDNKKTQVQIGQELSALVILNALSAGRKMSKQSHLLYFIWRHSVLQIH